MWTLENAQVRLTLDERGFLSELCRRETGHNYASGGPLWRFYYECDGVLDREVLAADAQPQIAREGEELVLRYPEVISYGRKLAVQVELRVRLEGEDVRWAIKLDNNQADIVIRDVHFPLVHGLNRRPDQALIWSHCAGQKLENPEAAVRSGFSYYMGPDNVFIQMQCTYPGAHATTNCFTFAGPDQGLYFGQHDPAQFQTTHLFRLYGPKFEAGLVRYANCVAGQSWQDDTAVLAPYLGTWHVAAQKYRRWADTWWRAPQIPTWVRRMNGWQRIIMKHQYGEVHYRFDEMPQIRQDGRQAGIDALFMFGWMKGGHDNQYPDYTPDEKRLGSETELKKNVAAFQADGGQVILYANGQLIDVNTAYYRQVGERICIKDQLGNAARDAYRFRGNGVYAGNFVNRTFVHACPASEEWFEKLADVVATAARYGCRAVFFDQLGYTPLHLCCDPSHGHPVPDLQNGWRRGELLRRLRERVKANDPDMGFGIEWVTDITAQHVDFIHSVGNFAAVDNGDWEQTGQKPRGRAFVEWFRYIFPEVILSDREIRDDTDIERRVNLLVLKGLRSDVEIYRCRRTIAETPHYREYLGRISALRQRQAELLLEGRYQDQLGFTLDNPELEARAFVNGDRLAVVVTQCHRPEESGRVTVPGYKYVSADGVGDYSVESQASGGKVRLGRFGLAVLVFQKA